MAAHVAGCTEQAPCSFCVAAQKAAAAPVKFELAMTVCLEMKGVTAAVLAHAIQIALEEAGICVDALSCKEAK
jgi:hypothetical protein